MSLVPIAASRCMLREPPRESGSFFTPITNARSSSGALTTEYWRMNPAGVTTLACIPGSMISARSSSGFNQNEVMSGVSISLATTVQVKGLRESLSVGWGWADEWPVSVAIIFAFWLRPLLLLGTCLLRLSFLFYDLLSIATLSGAESVWSGSEAQRTTGSS